MHHSGIKISSLGGASSWQREESQHACSFHTSYDGSQWSQTIEILDKDGNVIEENSIDRKGKVVDKTTYSYEYDDNGNWIVRKAFENKKIKGKSTSTLWYTSYRAITYYQ